MDDVYDFLEEILGNIVEALYNIYTKIVDFFSFDGWLCDAISFIKDSFEYYLSVFLSWLYKLIFDDLWSTCVSYGNYILSFLYNKFSLQTIGLSFLSYFVGLIFILFVFKKVWSLLR